MIDYQEEARLEALKRSGMLDTPASERFDRITRLACQIFGLQRAAISLTDVDRQWLKSRVGLGFQSMPRAKAPCAEVTQTGTPLVIPDLSEDPFYAESPAASSGVRFYAGAPLITRDGFKLGALFVLDTQPREVTKAEMEALVDLASVVASQIEAEHRSTHLDRVTGLPTETSFLNDLDDLAAEEGGERRFCVSLILGQNDEIENMASVLGSEHVDDMVRKAATVLRDALGPGRPLYHVAAMHFAFLSSQGWEEAAYVQMLRARLEELRAHSLVRFVTTMTLGVRPFVVGDTLPSHLLRSSFIAAQDARKVDGGVAVYAAERGLAQRRQFGLLNDFGTAVAVKDQLNLVYQPRVDLASGRCVGAEALLRWQHPVLGNIPPSEFIPIVEQTSLARAMTQWVLDAALDQLADWSTRDITLVVSINLSALNLAELDLTERVHAGLSARRLRPDQLEFELTESAIMDRPDQALVVLRQLAETGACLAIDDFGTGQSSLAYLQRVPARVLKIDQTFVRTLTTANGPDFVLVDTMIALGHRLGYRVVAEGIETKVGSDILIQAGCDEGQGYYYSRPMPADDFERWLTEGKQRSQLHLGVAA